VNDLYRKGTTLPLGRRARIQGPGRRVQRGESTVLRTRRTQGGMMQDFTLYCVVVVSVYVRNSLRLFAQVSTRSYGIPDQDFTLFHSLSCEVISCKNDDQNECESKDERRQCGYSISSLPGTPTVGQRTGGRSSSRRVGRSTGPGVVLTCRLLFRYPLTGKGRQAS